jgi:uncharacterized protein YbaR (Trm112 family)
VYVAVIELLRCPAGHEESPLVATAMQQRDRRILQGVLGCPVCGAQYPVERGIARFHGAAAADELSRSGAVPNEESAVRLAAQLDLTDAGRLVLLLGEYARLAPALTLMFDAQCVAINAPHDDERRIADGASTLRVAGRIPLAAGVVAGAAADATHATPARLQELRDLLRPRGRLVAPNAAPAPPGVTLLARDTTEWVAVREGDVVRLQRAAR